MMLPFLYFKSGIIDPWFNLFIFLSIYNIILFTNNPSGKKEKMYAVFAGVFLGLAVLTKGPAALVITALTLLAVLIRTKNIRLFYSKTFILFSLTGIFVSFSWFLFEWLSGNGHVIKEFIDYQVQLFNTGESGHDGPFFYHAVVLLLGCFPASIIFIAGYKLKNHLTPFQLLFRKFMICLFWVVLILFSIVKTKIVHYSSLCYFPVTFISALAIVDYLNVIKFSALLRILYWIIAVLISSAFILVTFINQFKEKLIQSDLIKDDFAKENLRAEVTWSGYEFMLGIIFLVGAYLIYRAIIKQNIKWIYAGLLTTMLFIYMAVLVIIPKVEGYTQNAAIQFYKYCANTKCYVETHSFKSYAYLFYSNRMPEDYKNAEQIKEIENFIVTAVKMGNKRHTSYASGNCYWMKHGNVDRNVFIVAKKNEESEMIQNKEFKKLFDKNGFSFFIRIPPKTSESLNSKNN